MFGNARYIYNWGLDLCIKARESGEKKPSAFDLHKLLTQHKKEEGKEWLQNSPNCSLQQSLTLFEEKILSITQLTDLIILPESANHSRSTDK